MLPEREDAPTPGGEPASHWTIGALAEEARRLAEGRDRCLLGIAGAPGAGKSTLASELLELLEPDAVVVGMDGFHLANRVLAEQGLLERKGAPETFDAAGFRILLARLRANDDEAVYAPEFHREIEEPIAGAVAVPRAVPIVIVEGNYLLLDDGPWRGVRDLFDEVWYLDLDSRTRRDRLLRRHVAFGKSPANALSWVRDSDERNAVLVEATAGRADKVLRAPVPA
ncbi:MAG TPA: nucleoside/nucleotide kinase family protein [Gaiellaceae bacterium]|nr:nucleoside/nucleotide kinase family protein [Gaiellaceae bacterium]